MKKILSAILFLICVKAIAQDTFSIVAVDPNTGEVGSAGASCLDNISFPGSGGAIIISDLLPGRGAIHTQSYWVAANQNNARQKMQEGLSPQEIITWLKQNDAEGLFGNLKRQYGIVDFDSMGQPRSAAHTGTSCFDWKGHRTGVNYAIQGNILLGPQILDSMEAHFIATEGLPLAIRLMYTLQGANVVGADSRCTANGTSSLSAFIRMAKPDDQADNLFLDLNVPSLPTGMEPIDSLQKLFDTWKAVTVQDITEPSFKVYPNPCRGGNFQVDWPYQENGALSIVSTTGQTIHTDIVHKGVNQFRIPLVSGCYTLSIIPAGNKTPVKQLITVSRSH